jgi:putative hydrolase of the HAD superfamily
LATNAAESDEAEIRLALKEVRLNAYFEHVFCARSLGVRKPDRAFFDFIGSAIKRPAEDLIMVGDDFEVDVLGANGAGIYAVWLNRLDTRRRIADQHTTILDWRELPSALLAQKI